MIALVSVFVCMCVPGCKISIANLKINIIYFHTQINSSFVILFATQIYTHAILNAMLVVHKFALNGNVCQLLHKITIFNYMTWHGYQLIVFYNIAIETIVCVCVYGFVSVLVQYNFKFIDNKTAQQFTSF